MHVLLLNADGTVKAERKISFTASGLVGPLDNSDYFGIFAAAIGGLNGDDVPNALVDAICDYGRAPPERGRHRQGGAEDLACSRRPRGPVKARYNVQGGSYYSTRRGAGITPPCASV